MSNSFGTTSGGGGGGGDRSAEKKSETKTTVSDRSAASSPKPGQAASLPSRKTDWHARAVAAFAAGRYDEAAAAWSHALAVTGITRCRGTELERILYLQRRGEAYARAGFPTLALDDLGWVLHIKGFGYSPNAELPGRTRLLRHGLAACTAYFDACVGAYEKCFVAMQSPIFAPSPSSSSAASFLSPPPPPPPSSPPPPPPTAVKTIGDEREVPLWLEAYSYLRSPTRHVKMYERLLDDLAAYARALDAFGNHERAFVVYTDLAHADRRTPESSVAWMRHAMTALGQIGRGGARGKTSNPKVANISKNLSAVQRKEFERRLTQSGDQVAIDRIHETWRTYGTMSRSICESMRTATAAAAAAAAAPSSKDDGVVEWQLGDGGGTKPMIECRRTRAFGRGIYACKNIKRGQVIWTEPPTYSANVDVAACCACARRAPDRVHACAVVGDGGGDSLPCGAPYCSERCRLDDRAAHRILCGLRLAPYQARIAKISFSTSGRTPLAVLHMLARVATRHNAAIAELLGARLDRIAHEDKHDAKHAPSGDGGSGGSSDGFITFPPIASFGGGIGGRSGGGDGGGGIGDDRKSARDAAQQQPMALSAMSDEPWLQSWIANVVDILEAEETKRTPTSGFLPRANLYAQYEGLRDEFLSHAFVHPQIFNVSNFYICMRFLILYSFAYPTAALNGLADDPYPTDAPDRKTSSPSPPPSPPKKPYNAVPAGVATHKVASCFNHSCEPNLDWTYSPFVRNEIVMLAACDVRAGDQLFISYINNDNPYQRRQEALMSYQFTCSCRKCVARE